MTTRSTRLLIVGAGPTGLTLACRCRQLGLDVRLIDRKTGPATTSNAIGLQYRVSEILAMLGIADRFIQEASSPTAVNLYVGERGLLRFQFLPNAEVAGKDAFHPRALIIPRSRTETILGEFFQELGGRVEWNTELVQHSQHQDAVIAVLRRPEGSEEQSFLPQPTAIAAVQSFVTSRAKGNQIEFLIRPLPTSEEFVMDLQILS